MAVIACSIMLTATICFGWFFGVVCSTDNRFATGPNNSHKLAYYREENLELERDAVTLVFQSQESIYLCVSGNGNPYHPWSRPIAYYPGKDPAITWGGDNKRHLVWVMTDTANRRLNIFYRNLDYQMLPINVNGSNQDCFHPDVWADGSGFAHIVWEEEVSPAVKQIYYRKADTNGVSGEKFQVSNGLGFCSRPAIERFGDEICVIWEQYDPTQPHWFRIMRRSQVNGIWQAEEVLAQNRQPLAHPSLDFSPGNEHFSVCWDMTACQDMSHVSNQEVFFYGGNPGGGFPTPGASRAPVMTTIEGEYSLYLWEEDSAGVKDIYVDLYSFTNGWCRLGSLRQLLYLNEAIYAPSCPGWVAVWTQGDSAPYKVMWSECCPPLGTAEPVALGTTRLKSTITANLLKIPDPDQPSYLLDITGRKVLCLSPGTNDITGLKPGIYYLQTGKHRERVIVVR